MHEEGRRYRVLGLVGSGGFGRVYRARLEADGFTKDVAIKVMVEDDPSEDVLHRFRDEARMLGLVRDRAIVAADPPVRIGGHWAVVMEFVDGCTLGRLIATNGPVPPSVALEIVGEVARALDKVFHHPGPSGQPLGLLHRDLKPANLQITAHGEVKILDFGVARAELDDREAKTRGLLLGTTDYMAPERLQGLEVPAGDVYSLGRVLEEMLLGRRRTKGEGRIDPNDAEDPALKAALQLGNEMTRLDPDVRPGARDVEHRCEVLLAATGRNPSLRAWAERTVPGAAVQLGHDGLVGEVLSEAASAGRRAYLLGDRPPAERPEDASGAVAPPPAPVPPPAPSARPVAVGAAVAVAGIAIAAVVGIGVVIAGAAGVAGLVALRTPVSPDDLRASPDAAADPEEGAVQDGFASLRNGGAPAEIPGMRAPVDTGQPHVAPSGPRADLVLGQGRAAILELGMAPTAYTKGRGLEVVEAPPYLVLSGAVPGRGTLEVDFGGNTRSWVYDVGREPALDPSGGPSLLEGIAERLTMPPGVGAICTLDVVPRATILMDEDRARLEPMGLRGFYLQANQGLVDVVFDVDGQRPRVITLEARAEPLVGDAGQVDAPPPGCVLAPEEPVRIPVGGELTLPVGQPVDVLVVGDADRFEVMRVEDDTKKVRVRALRPGQTAVAITDTDGVVGWVRRVVSE